MNIKKFLTVLILGLAVFAVSCSKDDESSTDPTAQEQFLASVKDQTDVAGTADGYPTVAKFSSTGEGIAIMQGDSSYSAEIPFASCASATEGTYSSGTHKAVVTITSGTITFVYTSNN